MNFFKTCCITGFAALLPALAGAQASIPNYEFSSVAIDYPVNAGTNPTYSLQGTLGQTFATIDTPTNTGQTLAYAGFQQTYVPFAYLVSIALEGYVGNASAAVIYGQGVNIPFTAETFDTGNLTTPAEVPSNSSGVPIAFYANSSGVVKVLSTLNPAFAGAVSIQGPIWLRAQGTVTLPSDPVNGYPTVALLTLGAGDSDGNNAVNTTDFNTLIGSYGGDASIAGSGYDPTADFDANGVINTGDFNLLIGEFGNTGSN